MCQLLYFNHYTKTIRCKAHTCFELYAEDELHVSRSIAQLLQRNYNF